MKQLLAVLALSLTLSACGNPSVVAYSRAMILQREAEDEAKKNHDIVDNKIEAKYFQAIEQYNSAIRFDPKLVDAYYRRGICRDAIKQYDAALEDFSVVTGKKPDDAYAWMRRGKAEMALQKFDEALKDFTAADSLKPDVAWVLLKRSACKNYTGDHKGALEDAKKCVELKPDVETYCSLASAQRALGDYAAMEESYKTALKAYPHELKIYRARAYNEFAAGRYRAAWADFDKLWHAKYMSDDEDAPYTVLLGSLSARLDNREGDANTLLDDGVAQLKLPTEVDAGAHNAQVANDWPKPVLQYMHNDITRDKLLRAAQGDIGKETEGNTYLALEAFLKGDRKEAKRLFDWVVENGRKDYVEYWLSKRMQKKLQP